MKWFADLEEAKIEAGKTHKQILIQFEMPGCGGCKKLYDTTYQDKRVQEEMNECFVLLKLDLIKNREIRKSLGAYWTPAIYILDINENSYFHFNGYLPTNEFRAMLRLGLAETLMPRGKYDEIINIIDKDLDDLKETSLYPNLLVARETARYITIKDNSQLKKVLKEIQISHPKSTEAHMYFWD